MAGKGKPGPNKGAPNSGRPRLKTHKPDVQGYTRSTTGPPGRGTLRLDQDIKMGVSNLGHRGKVVDHVDHKRTDNAKGNLRLVTRAANRANITPGKRGAKRK